VRIVEEDLSGPEIARLLGAHLAHMRSLSPPESVHALDLEGLRAPELTFWSAWRGDELVGCAGLKALGGAEGEIKSMHTLSARRGSGVGAALLGHVIEAARERGWRRLLLETGSQDGFAPARALYERFGFTYRDPFAAYREDPNSVFMQLELG
jgi:putative acetyltransferase